MDVFNILKQLEMSNGGWVAAEGSYMKATNTTIGTGVAPPTTPTAFSATSALLTIQNPLGILVLTAASANVIQIGCGSIKAVSVTSGPLLVKDDEYVFSFGRGDSLTSALKQNTASVPFLYRQHAGVIAVPPGGTFCLHV